MKMYKERSMSNQKSIRKEVELIESKSLFVQDKGIQVE